MTEFRQAMRWTFCLIPSPFSSVTVNTDSIDNNGHTLPINRSTRMSKSSWGYVCVDTNCDREEGPFVERVYPRMMNPEGFLNAVRDAKANLQES